MTLSDTNHTPETVSNCHLPRIDSIVPSDNSNLNLFKNKDPSNGRLTIENCPVNQNHQPDNSPKTPFKEVFTLPVEYLPKKKRCRIEKTGKSKLPSVGTSDEWYTLQLKKESLKKQQEEKKQKKKRLQEEKNALMEQLKLSFNIKYQSNNHRTISVTQGVQQQPPFSTTISRTNSANISPSTTPTGPSNNLYRFVHAFSNIRETPHIRSLNLLSLITPRTCLRELFVPAIPQCMTRNLIFRNHPLLLHPHSPVPDPHLLSPPPLPPPVYSDINLSDRIVSEILSSTYPLYSHPILPGQFTLGSDPIHIPTLKAFLRTAPSDILIPCFTPFTRYPIAIPVEFFRERYPPDSDQPHPVSHTPTHTHTITLNTHAPTHTITLDAPTHIQTITLNIVLEP
ncbi:hypothetical protein EAG_01981 [Camponotus floridanus]|uniref:Uncharacterized protein n=1 Tax=Camponotus floridanus TaxID=104421 RepID=E2ACY8_CAMFO|nr:hypothetical protein EAG_01981 [Camponotus floridanus]